CCRRATASLLPQLGNPATHGSRAYANCGTGLANRIALVKHQTSGFSLKFSCKRMSTQNGTPLYPVVAYHLHWCPKSLDHFTTGRRWDWLCCRSTASVRTGQTQIFAPCSPPIRTRGGCSYGSGVGLVF